MNSLKVTPAALRRVYSVMAAKSYYMNIIRKFAALACVSLLAAAAVEAQAPSRDALARLKEVLSH